jgi:murein DD-endopeptidase MepM/ murein hydrolase activator NlpD
VRIRVDAFAIVAIAFLGFLLYNALADWGTFDFAAGETPQSSAQSADELAAPLATGGVLSAPTMAPPEIDVDALRYPYDTFTLTQGPHGMSYGHLAIDLTAGKGATILSPINGTVAKLYTDEYGNPTLIIENAHYQVTLMHGLYTVQVGENLYIGQPVGTESNQGYTLGPGGILCRGLDCGYHTHLNVFDKYIGTNVNPLEVIKK